MGIIEKLGIVESGGGNPDFQDLSFKVRLPTKNAGIFSLFGLGGDFISEDDYTSFFDGPRRDIFSGQTGIIGLSHLLTLSNKTYLKTVVAANYAGRFYDDGRLNIPSEGNFDQDYTEFFEDKSTRISLLLNHKFNSKHVLQNC